MQALDGFLTPLQKQLILQVINHIDDMTKRIGQMDDLVKRCTGGYEEALEKLDKIPAGGNGYRHESVCNGEASVQLGRPGNNESAGKRHSNKTAKGNATLSQCARAAIKKKAPFLSAQYERFVVQRGAKRATVTVAHTMLTPCSHHADSYLPHIEERRSLCRSGS